MIVTMSSCNLKNDLVIESCILDDENQYLVKAMIDNDCIDYSFVNSVIVSNICETLVGSLPRRIGDEMNISLTILIHAM
jgi:hypothetical protein